MQTQNNGHSIFSPSKAHRYVRCPGSVAMESVCPDKTSGYAIEGTAAHKFSEMVLTGTVASANEMLGETLRWMENGVAVTWKINADMVDHVQRYVDRIRERVAEFEMLPDVKKVTLLVEQKVDFSAVVGIPNQFGTADIIIEVEFNDGSLILSVEDLKYGMGVKVDAEDNEQTMTYAAGVLSAYELVGAVVRKIYVAIHQIRVGHHPEVEYTVDEIQAFVEKLHEAAQLAHANLVVFNETNDAARLNLTPGDKQCRFCRAKAHCPALTGAVMSTVIDDFDAVDDGDEKESVEKSVKGMGMVTLDALSRYMQAIPLIEDWCKAVRARVEAEMFAGKTVPGFKLVEGKRGARAWTDSHEAEDVLEIHASETGRNVFYVGYFAHAG